MGPPRDEGCLTPPGGVAGGKPPVVVLGFWLLGGSFFLCNEGVGTRDISFRMIAKAPRSSSCTVPRWYFSAVTRVGMSVMRMVPEDDDIFLKCVKNKKRRRKKKTRFSLLCAGGLNSFDKRNLYKNRKRNFARHNPKEKNRK